MAYQFIKAWGKILRSNSGYVQQQIEKAERDNAPFDAIYYSETDHRWIVVGEACETTRESVYNVLNAYTSKKKLIDRFGFLSRCYGESIHQHDQGLIDYSKIEELGREIDQIEKQIDNSLLGI